MTQTAEETLKRIFTAFDNSKTNNEKAPLVSEFKLITLKWPDNWLANYYAAYSNVVLSFDEQEKEKRVTLLDEADVYYETIKFMAHSNEEVNILGAFIAIARNAASDSSDKKHEAAAANYLQIAKTMNHNNPRIYLLEGNIKLIFDRDPKSAIAFYEKADTLFCEEKDTDISRPYWGGSANTHFLNICKGALQGYRL